MTVMTDRSTVRSNEYDLNLADRRTDELADLDVVSVASDIDPKALKGLSVIVIGGGPAGLTFAKSASAHGADVTVLEKAGDPRGTNPGYTNRSFNITLDAVGRYVLADDRAWKGGVRLVGRAIHEHDGSGAIHQSRYGEDPDNDLISIPRPILRQNMVNLAMETGTEIRFHCTVTELDPDHGVVGYTDVNGTPHRLTADLVIVSDGLHSIGDRYLREVNGEKCSLKTETWSTVSTLMHPEHGSALSRHHIHVWNELDSHSCAVGIPNVDGSIGILLVSAYSDEFPFPTPQLAAERLQHNFPKVYAISPKLAEELPTRRRHHFYYKSVSSFVIGKKAVLVGDSGRVIPPWAGYGANSAMYSASNLEYQLIKYRGDLGAALDAYDAKQVVISRLLLDFALQQGDFLLGEEVTQMPDARSEDYLAKLIKQAGTEVGDRKSR